MSAQADVSVAGYLLIRLKQMGIDHLFGVPGDFVLGFLNEVLESEVRYIGTCNELNAAYAADGWMRDVTADWAALLTAIQEKAAELKT